METARMGKEGARGRGSTTLPASLAPQRQSNKLWKRAKQERTKIMTQFEMEQQWEDRNMRLAWSDTCEPDRTYHEQEARRAHDRARRERAWEQQQVRGEEWQKRSAAEEEYRRRQEQQRLESEYRREEERRRLEEQRRRDEETRRNREEERRRANRW
jgi:hypothetical protein